ncbi:hypothetical protein QLQ12_14565 [Actinoplanes sp. NEAU-A12]|uniref:Uncharacterized protein n=1 Tax=Actinoplanes sandaracinus TaxID=3045177 RepID=A0ABT6WJB7_9ACTN|nr:hypothetical protein [Actinoplanes sandaracinus]MDI6099822.1 hypothetical protein [Actinoplanes sandaracinus]
MISKTFTSVTLCIYTVTEVCKVTQPCSEKDRRAVPVLCPLDRRVEVKSGHPGLDATPLTEPLQEVMAGGTPTQGPLKALPKLTVIIFNLIAFGSDCIALRLARGCLRPPG